MNKKLNRNAYNVLGILLTFANQNSLFREFNFLKRDIYVNKGTLQIFDIFK